MALWTPDFVQDIDPAPRRFRVTHDDLPLWPGVVVTPWDATPLAVRQNGGGAMTVTVDPGMAWVANSTTRQGLYNVVNDASVTSPTIGNNSSGNPRIDRIVLTVRDDIDGGATAGQKDAIIQVVQGTPTSGATLLLPLGAPTVPNHSLLLADVLVPNGAASILTANIIDRRPWAHGHFSRRRVSTAGANQTFTTTTAATLFDTQLTRRAEITAFGSHCIVQGTLIGRATFPAAAGLGLTVSLATSTDGGSSWTPLTARTITNQAATAADKPINIRHWAAIAGAGTYLFGWRVALTAANATGVTVYGATGTANATAGIIEQLPS